MTSSSIPERPSYLEPSPLGGLHVSGIRLIRIREFTPLAKYIVLSCRKLVPNPGSYSESLASLDSSRNLINSY